MLVGRMDQGLLRLIGFGHELRGNDGNTRVDTTGDIWPKCVFPESRDVAGISQLRRERRQCPQIESNEFGNDDVNHQITRYFESGNVLRQSGNVGGRCRRYAHSSAHRVTLIMSK